MPEKPIQPPTPEQGKKPAPPEKGTEKKPMPQEKQVTPKKKTPAQKKDDRFKFEMKYVNGGFNNGVQVKPDKDGKALLEIAIYGGGEKKTLSVGPLPKEITKLIQAYEVGANQNTDVPEITGELQKFFAQIQEQLSIKIINILKEADEKVATAIKETFKSANGRNKNDIKKIT